MNYNSIIMKYQKIKNLLENATNQVNIEQKVGSSKLQITWSL